MHKITKPALAETRTPRFHTLGMRLRILSPRHLQAAKLPKRNFVRVLLEPTSGGKHNQRSFGFFVFSYHAGWITSNVFHLQALFPFTLLLEHDTVSCLRASLSFIVRNLQVCKRGSKEHVPWLGIALFHLPNLQRRLPCGCRIEPRTCYIPLQASHRGL